MLRVPIFLPQCYLLQLPSMKYLLENVALCKTENYLLRYRFKITCNCTDLPSLSPSQWTCQSPMPLVSTPAHSFPSSTLQGPLRLFMSTFFSTALIFLPEYFFHEADFKDDLSVGLPVPQWITRKTLVDPFGFTRVDWGRNGAGRSSQTFQSETSHLTLRKLLNGAVPFSRPMDSGLLVFTMMPSSSGRKSKVKPLTSLPYFQSPLLGPTSLA